MCCVVCVIQATGKALQTTRSAHRALAALLDLRHALRVVMLAAGAAPGLLLPSESIQLAWGELQGASSIPPAAGREGLQAC